MVPRKACFLQTQRICQDQTCAFCRIECRKFDSIRFICRIGFFRFDRPHSRMSNIRHPKHPSSDVGFFRLDRPSVECRIFDIRSTLLRIGFFRFDRPHSRMSNIRHPKWLHSDIKHSMSAGCSLQLLTRHHTIYLHCIIVF